MLNKKALAGTPSTPAVFVEDVFSTYLYTGNGSTQTITNGIDLAGKGGLFWIKRRNAADASNLLDTARGTNSVLSTEYTNAADTAASWGISSFAFNSNGVSWSGSSANNNNSSGTYCSWAFRKQAKFFDVVTYTGTGSARTVAHNLGSVPGMMLIKQTNTGGADWAVFHRSQGKTKYGLLNTTAAFVNDTGGARWNDTDPTSTVFSVGNDTEVNANGSTYVAYLFAHDAGGFGTAGTDNVISCSSFTTDGSGNATVSLGYEPQWVLTQSTSGGTWQIQDSMRGMPVGAQGQRLRPNSTAVEDTTNTTQPNATGFSVTGFGASQTYIYIAIRRGPMKTPTSGTSVYNAIARTGTSAAATVTGVGFAPDKIITHERSNTNNVTVVDRLRGASKNLYTDAIDAENSDNYFTLTNQNGFGLLGAGANLSARTYVYWNFRRAPGFFDVVCYTGTGSNTTFNHNLGVVPELIIVKSRTIATNWNVYSSGIANTEYLVLNTTAAKVTGTTRWNSTTPTSSVFTLGSSGNVNGSGETHVAYLFATVTGVSKVGSYTGNGSNLTIPCGFTAGARFVLIKRTDSTGDWYVWDSTRGINIGDDPHLSLNTTAAEVTTDDSVDADNSGFIVNQLSATDINVNNATYIFLAIA